MEPDRWSWWRRHGPTALLLVGAASIAFLVRSVWMLPLLQQFGAPNLFGGGSDSFYHFRVANYIVQNHTNLIKDQLLNYPVGAINPREPLFDWMNAVLAIIFAPLFGGNPSTAAAFFLEFQGPFWAALGVFPVYLIGREISDRRVGIVAGFIYALTVANINSSTFGYANYLSFYTFFILLTIFGYLRTIKSAGTRRWVTKYTQPRQIPAAIRAFVRTERSAVKWAVFTGVSFGTLALAWQGYSFVVAALVIFVIFALLVERIRRVDSFGLYIATWIVGLVGFPMAMPYYLGQGLILGWFGLPLLVFAGGLLVCLPLIVLRDQPWIFSIPVFIVVGLAAIGSLDFINHAQFVNIVTGQGYFVKTLVYSTVAEAQAPSIDALILGYGVITFFVAFVGLALWLYRMVRGRFPRVMMMAVVFASISIYLPISAAKFFFLGSAAFALLPAEALIRALDVAEFPKLRRTVAQLADRRSQFAAFRRAFKVRHVLVPLLVVGLLLPNIWYSIDGGIPYNSKGAFNQQVYNSLPSFLQTAPTNASTFYLGAAGSQLDSPPQYDEAGYQWLSQQDQNLTPANRPAFISWWDYGFQAVAQGQHPSVADNFQNGIVPAGNFLLAQNESLAIGILTTTLLTGVQKSTGQTYLPGALNQILARDGVDLPVLHNLLANQSFDIQLVLNHPERYLAVDHTHLDGINALYDASSWELAHSMTLTQIAQVYNDVQSYTHWSIRYAMVDNRLFPFSGQSTGIFYAPADLTDRVISAGGAPTAYYSVNITGSDGNTYPYGQLPAGVTAQNYPINYYPAFYNSMIYRIFIGYNASQAGLGTTPNAQIPGVNVQGGGPMPGWMMQHFQLVYRTAYYCPFKTTTGHPGCQVAMNLPDANRLARLHNGSVDASEGQYANGGGEMILQYYSGLPMTGTVQLPDGHPVPNVRVTVYDSFGIPHMATTTDANGAYSVLLPPGNDTVNITTGKVNLQNQAGTTLLLSLNENVPSAAGLSLEASTMIRPIVLKPSTVDGLVYWNIAKNNSYVSGSDTLAVGATAVLWGGGSPRHTTTDASGAYRFNDVAPGTYNLTVLYRGTNYTNLTSGLIYAQPGQLTNRSVGLGPATLSGGVKLPDGRPAAGALVTVSDALGVIANATVEPSGNYSIANIPPGNLSLRASVPSLGLSAPPVALVAVKEGQKVSQNLTLQAFSSVSLAVLSGGTPVAGFPVRFIPWIPFPLPSGSSAGAGGVGPGPGPNGSAPSSNASGPVRGPVNANGTVFFTGPDGTLTGQLPIGNYSVYGLGLVSGAWAAGIATAAVSGGSVSLAPLQISPAARISGSIQVQNAGTGAVVQLLAYDRAGDAAWTFTNSSGDWGISLPLGSYTLLAIQPPSSGHPSSYAGIATTRVTGNAVVGVSMDPAVLFRPLVGAQPAQAGPIVPTPGARVELSIPSIGAHLTSFANDSGNVTFYLPAALPTGASFCVNATAAGYSGSSHCGLSSTTVSQFNTIGLSPNGSALSVTLQGLPLGARATVNLTAVSPSASTVVLTGGSSLIGTITPGTYRLSAWAPSGSVGLYATAATVNLTVPIAAPSVSVSLSLVHEVSATGLLLLPANLTGANVTVQLYGSQLSASMTGTAFTDKFLIVPGSYTVLANALSPSPYATLTKLTFNGTGAPSGPLDLNNPGTTLTMNLSLPGGSVGNSTIHAMLTSGNGLSIPIAFSNGRFVGGVPSGTTFTVSLDSVQLIDLTDGSRYAELKVAPFAPPCRTSGVSTICAVPIVATSILSGISGELRLPGFPGAVGGTLELIGPGGSDNLTSVTVAGGSFNLSVAPGTYTVYAHSVSGSALFANLSQITVGPNATVGLVVQLQPAWTDSLTVTSPAGSTPLGPAKVTAITSNGLQIIFPDLPLGVPASLVLPAGTYSITGSASGSPYGVLTNATAKATASLYFGNAATNLALAWQFHRTVAFHLSGEAVRLGNGGVTTFPFSVVNTGNVPFSFRFIGSPLTYNFTFTPANATLGLSATNDSISGTVRISIPEGTPVEHPPIQLEALVTGATSSAAGFASPAPSITLTPAYALVLGPGSPGSASTAPFNVSVPFYLRNTGNAPESVLLSVSDSVRLSGIGWHSVFIQGTKLITTAVSLGPGANNTYAVELTSTTPHALRPGSVTVVATVQNGSAALRETIVMTVPTNTVSIGTGGLAVVGQGLGSPPSYPDWLVPVLAFVPAAAFLAIAGAWRWYRTRRWTRR